jgi:vancomycin permeability regulator SanA
MVYLEDRDLRNGKLMLKFFQKTLLVISTLVIGVFVFATVLFFHVRLFSAQFSSNNPNSIPKTRVAIVYGAEVYNTYTLSPILQDRVNGAIELYKKGIVQKLLMSGDNSSIYYNEVVAMQEYAIKHGVPSQDITLDYAGFTTYDSCYRAKQIFGVKQAILVTQAYHQPRAIYICRSLGIDAYGYSLPDWTRYPQLKYDYVFREYLATVKAFWQIHTKALPKFLGNYIGIQ